MIAMKEQLARAIAIKRGRNPDVKLSYGDNPTWSYFVEDVEAVLEALLEPTEAMIKAGEACDYYGSPNDGYSDLRGCAAEHWAAMIKDATR